MKFPLMNLESLPITLRAEIPEHYRDSMGHMNVMWYTNLFSHAFVKFAQSFGFDEAYMRSHHAGSFALETHTRYLAEVNIGNHVTIRTRLLGRSPKRIHFMHFMTIDQTGSLAATQEHIGAHIDMRVRRMAPFADEILARYDSILAEHNKLPWEAPTSGPMRP